MKKNSLQQIAKSCFVLTVLACVFSWQHFTGPVLAQDDSGWSAPVLVFEGQGRVGAPTITADDYGQVHGFWVFIPETVGDSDYRQLYYARLDRLDWQPIDIAIMSSNTLTLTSASNNSRLALVWGAGNFIESGPTPKLSARDWSSSQTIGSTYPNPRLNVAPDGAVWMAFGDIATNAVFVRRQDPNTGQWESPLFVANPFNSGSAPDYVRITFGPDNTLHLVWAEYLLPNGWPPRGVYYSRSTDSGQNWSAPREMAGAGTNQPNILAGKGETLYMSWVGIAGVGGKYVALSTNAGVTWGGATSLFSAAGGGSEGAPNMVLDASGRVHALFSNGNCVWYTTLQPDGWTDPDCISRNIASSHTEHPVMTIGLGNQLHVLFWTNDRQMWYMTRQLSVAGKELLPTPTPAIPTAIPPTVPPTPVPTPTHLPDYGAPGDLSLTAQVGTWSVLAGIIPVVLLVGIVYLIRFRR